MVDSFFPKKEVALECSLFQIVTNDLEDAKYILMTNGEITILSDFIQAIEYGFDYYVEHGYLREDEYDAYYSTIVQCTFVFTMDHYVQFSKSIQVCMETLAHQGIAS